ncbi:polyphosphate kinase 2 family protein [Rubrivirga sp.]|uniref:polyphosphate kinase 2 family protein n=1 Tax=Rubrivirga sp. TaxID=1885344 RepID=UPI003B519289
MSLDLDRYRIAPGDTVRLSERPTDDDGGLDKDEGKDRLDDNVDRARDLQERLYAEDERSVLFVFQAMDAGGKDSTTEHVFGPMNPQGVRVASFKAPSTLEKSHDFLWRVHAKAPERGMIRVFNRSHYEDVLIVKVHGWAEPDVIERRYDHIRNFEALLADAGTRVVKVMLNISKDYQLERFRRRLERPDKHWKFNPDDLDERKLWDDYMRAFEVAIERTSTEAAPWYVVPAETRWYRDLVVSQILVDTLEALDPQYPEPDFDPADYPPGSIE